MNGIVKGSCLVLALAVLAGCSVSADEGGMPSPSGSSALFSNGVHRGVLACSGGQSRNADVQTGTTLEFVNDNASGSISIDRIEVYSRAGGNPVCVLDDVATMGPHASAILRTTEGNCFPTPEGPSEGKLRFHVYWSRTGEGYGALLPLDGYSQMLFSAVSGGEPERVLRECKAIEVRRGY
jgi:hypothetical protein